jgi:hypothetical protein
MLVLRPGEFFLVGVCLGLHIALPPSGRAAQWATHNVALSLLILPMLHVQHSMPVKVNWLLSQPT